MKLVVEGQKIYSFDSPPVKLVEGSVEFVDVEFDCTSEWDGLLMTVQFIQKGTTTNVYIGEARSLKIPPEIKAGWLMISCFGVKEGTATFGTVNGYETEVDPSSVSSTEREPIPPTPNLYNQLVTEVKKYADEAQESADKVEEAQQTAQEAKNIADTIQANAEAGLYNGKDGTNGTNGVDGTDGVSPTVSTEEIVGGTRVDITDVNGSHSFDVMDGVNGTDGEAGPQGIPGKDGNAATIQIGTVQTGEPDTQASVSNSGNENNAVLDFVIPRGEAGLQGPKGETGDSYFKGLDLSEGTIENPIEINEGGLYIVTSRGYLKTPGNFNNINRYLVEENTIVMIRFVNGRTDYYYVALYSDNNLILGSQISGGEYTCNFLGNAFESIEMIDVLVTWLSPLFEAQENQIITFGEVDSESGLPMVRVVDADAELSDASKLPVQNKAVKEAIDNLDLFIQTLSKDYSDTKTSLQTDVSDLQTDVSDLQTDVASKANKQRVVKINDGDSIQVVVNTDTQYYSVSSYPSNVSRINSLEIKLPNAFGGAPTQAYLYKAYFRFRTGDNPSITFPNGFDVAFVDGVKVSDITFESQTMYEIFVSNKTLFVNKLNL